MEKQQPVTVTTLESVPGREILAILGVVSGWGPLVGFNCDLAIKRMVEQAAVLGANAVLGVAVTEAHSVDTGGVAAYGTAVKIR